MSKHGKSAKEVLADLEALGAVTAGPRPAVSKKVEPIKFDDSGPSVSDHETLLEALRSALSVPESVLGGPLKGKPFPSYPSKTVDAVDLTLSKTISDAECGRIADILDGFEADSFPRTSIDTFDPPHGFGSVSEVLLHPKFTEYTIREEGCAYIVNAENLVVRVAFGKTEGGIIAPAPRPEDAPESDDFYLKPDWYDTLETLVERGATVLLIGPAGCGKTQAVENIFKEREQPLEIVSCTPRTTANDLEGATDLVIEDGQQVTRFTPASPALASEKGYGLLLDEADAAPSEAMYSMYRLLDKKPMHIVRKGFEGEVPLHADFRIIGTQNTEGRGDDKGLYHGRSYQDEAFLDRWSAVIRVDYPSLEQEVLILRKRAGISGADAELIVKAAQGMRKALQADEILFTCTMRRTLAVAANIDAGFDVRTSWELAALNRATTEDRAKLSEILNRIYGSKFTSKRKRKRKKPIAK